MPLKDYSKASNKYKGNGKAEASIPAGLHDDYKATFLTEAGQQEKYRERLLNALKPGGHLIIGTFTTEAPPKCSGLPVQRYNQKQLENTLGDAFELMRHNKALHITPGGVEQMYLYCHFRKIT